MLNRIQREEKEWFKVKSVYVVDYATTPPLEFNVGWPAASDQLLYARLRTLAPEAEMEREETTTPDPFVSYNQLHISSDINKRMKAQMLVLHASLFHNEIVVLLRKKS